MPNKSSGQFSPISRDRMTLRLHQILNPYVLFHLSSVSSFIVFICHLSLIRDKKNGLRWILALREAIMVVKDPRLLITITWGFVMDHPRPSLSPIYVGLLGSQRGGTKSIH
ncbi:hypothetical protein L228DRAFT_173199 [Xylona heveae TC161]|uniref:Uncharacterized protein n=1 Tax=Xylona heveae (strain CBS 132557 / TC161) TaxID=1328760 RepID=A0A165AIC5_XYLHT|nr:hypothetical protein L228DRAFT_173199 [Xylona heveae TC161]KZF20526.1 hypothetical protein L228DRAFT_173199 [Xylona heveae TC161]